MEEVIEFRGILGMEQGSSSVSRLDNVWYFR